MGENLKREDEPQPEQVKSAIDVGPKTTEPVQDEKDLISEIPEGKFSEKEAKEYKNWAKEIIKKWHDEIKPSAIILTETKGVGYGYILKETWKNAYPEENPPNFFRIVPMLNDPTGKKRDSYDSNLKFPAKVKKYLEKRMRDNTESRVVIYDEMWWGQDREGQHATSVTEQLYKDGEFQKQKEFPTGAVSRIAGLLCDAGLQNIWKTEGSPDKKVTPVTLKDFMDKGSNPKNQTENYDFIYDNLVGVTYKDPKLRRQKLQSIQGYKKLGRESGEELRAELEKK